MIAVFKNMRISHLSEHFKMDVRNYVYKNSRGPVLTKILNVISRKMNFAFVNQIISVDYISGDCFFYIRKSLFSGYIYTLKISRLDNLINRDEQLKQKYFREILLKKCEIDLFLISNSNSTS